MPICTLWLLPFTPQTAVIVIIAKKNVYNNHSIINNDDNNNTDYNDNSDKEYIKK